jgi:DNA (cytosine-5)-methyltransferase 1
MSFPEDYYLGDKYSKKAERLGRAVPPLMMKALAEHIYNNILSKIN